MTPLRFEQTYEADWTELEVLLNQALGRKRGSSLSQHDVSGERLAALYRRACEHLALARARAYPAYLVERLERLTSDGHQLIYQRRDYGIARLRELVAVDFPAAVRANRRYVAVAAAAFWIPTLVLGVLIYAQPELILSVVSWDTAAGFEQMYSKDAESIGRVREAATDWTMFGFYIRNNISVSFQCFAGGLFAGVGTLFFLVYNGAFGGAVAGYLVARGLSSTFFSFVATHSAFEITAIVLSGAAGLKIGSALIWPGRRTRLQSLVTASRDSATLLYGVIAMLLVAAGVEAFWSSASWLPPYVKYSVAAMCWAAVIGYFTFQGRRRAD